MKLSYIIPVLNSPEIVRRQILHWGRMTLPTDVEIIIMDDGSDPPLATTGVVQLANELLVNVVIRETGETRPWTSSIARNRGARIAQSDNLLFADVDYIFPKDSLMEIRSFTGCRMAFKREFGVLDEDGRFTQEKDVLLAYGLLPDRYAQRGPKVTHHPNVFAMRKDVFWEIGGYDEDLVLRRQYPQGEDNLFKRRWCQWERAGNGTTTTAKERIYMFPSGQFCGDVDYNPHGLFHDLSRKTRTNIFWKRQLRREAHEQVHARK